MEIEVPKVGVKTCILALDPGFVNMGWAVLNPDTGRVFSFGVCHVFDSIQEVEKGERNKNFIDKCRDRLGEFFDVLSIALAFDSIEIESQIVTEMSAPSRVRTLSLIFENMLISVATDYFPKNIVNVVEPSAYKKFYSVTGETDKKYKKKAVEKCKEFLQGNLKEEFQKSYSADTRPHIADAVLMAEYRWEMNKSKK